MKLMQSFVDLKSMFDDANVVEVGATFGDCHPEVCAKDLPAIGTVL